MDAYVCSDIITMPYLSKTWLQELIVVSASCQLLSHYVLSAG
jgi:hypothetical protein